jgi:type II secretory pathway pseudopilin PulG
MHDQQSEKDLQNGSNPAPTDSSIAPQLVQSNTASQNSMHPKEAQNSGIIILQWLTYAFWGWTVLAMSVLVSTVMSHFIADTEVGDFIAYPIASVVVLLPLSIICDVFYRKKEPLKKTGPSSLVMVIHAVLFALFGIGSLIVAVFCFVALFLSNSDTTGTRVALFSALIISVLYGATFLRTLNPARLPWARRYYIFFVGVITVVFCILGIVGPAVSARATRDDKLLENNLRDIENAVDDYASENNRLPQSLDDLELENEAKDIRDRNLVTYKANTKAASTTTRQQVFYYQLCAKFVEKSKYYSRSNSSNTYVSYGYYYNHDKGEQCFKLSTGYVANPTYESDPL